MGELTIALMFFSLVSLGITILYHATKQKPVQKAPDDEVDEEYEEYLKERKRRKKVIELQQEEVKCCKNPKCKKCLGRGKVIMWGKK